LQTGFLIARRDGKARNFIQDNTAMVCTSGASSITNRKGYVMIEALNKLYLELSLISDANTKREIELEKENLELKRLIFEITHSDERKKITECLWIPIVHEYSNIVMNRK
jgi:hypothetical protein